MDARAVWRGLSVEEWIYLALVASLPVMQPLTFEIGGHAVVPADALCVLTFVALAASVSLGRRRLQWHPWYAYLGLYLATAIVSTVSSEDARRSAVKLAGIIDLVSMAVLTTVFVTSIEALRRVVTAWLAGLAITVAAALTGIALFEAGITGQRNIFLYSYGSLPPGPYPRVMALFLNANMLCSYIAAGTLILLAARAVGWIGRPGFVILLAGSVVTAVASLSPGLGGVALAAAIWYAGRIRNGSPVLARLALSAGWTAAIAMLIAATISPVGLSAGSLAEGNLAPSSRVLTWQGAWSTFSAHPWIGKGVGLPVADVHYVDASGGPEALTDAHNAWLSVLAQQGIAGFAAFVLIVWYVVKRRERIVVTGSSLAVVRSGLHLAIIGGFLYASLAGSFESTRHVWVLMGLAAAARTLREPAVADPPALRGDRDVA